MGLISLIGLLLYGWAETSVFIFIGNRIGGLLTLFGVFLTAIIGIALLKNQGLSVLKSIGKDISKGHAPVTPIVDSISLVIGGILMVIPGYCTDALGLFLFIPRFRTIAGVFLLRWISKNQQFTSFVNQSGTFTKYDGKHSGIDNNQGGFGFTERHHQKDDYDDIIEGEFEERPFSESKIKQEQKTKL